MWTLRNQRTGHKKVCFLSFLQLTVFAFGILVTGAGMKFTWPFSCWDFSWLVDRWHFGESLECHTKRCVCECVHVCVAVWGACVCAYMCVCGVCGACVCGVYVRWGLNEGLLGNKATPNHSDHQKTFSASDTYAEICRMNYIHKKAKSCPRQSALMHQKCFPLYVNLFILEQPNIVQSH